MNYNLGLFIIMKIGVLSNFTYPHQGGSEAVIQAVTSQLANKYNHHINIYSHSRKRALRGCRIDKFPCAKGDKLISQINENDHVLVYSDSFWGWDTLVRDIDKIDCKVSVCLVGAYYMQSHPEIFRLLKQNKHKFNLITHSAGPDYKWAVENGLKPHIIPNGVNLSEFSENKINFRKKYNISEDKKILLTVGNYFYGKGNDILPDIYNKISKIRDDIVCISISCTTDYPYDKLFLSKCKNKVKDNNFIFLRDINREDVVAAFNSSDIFVMPSKKEVAPLVILESRASGLPWVSMDVGNVKEQTGGEIIPTFGIDKKGYISVDERGINCFSESISDILKCEEKKQNIIKEGQKDINKIDWKNIVPLYNEVFTS